MDQNPLDELIASRAPFLRELVYKALGVLLDQPLYPRDVHFKQEDKSLLISVTCTPAQRIEDRALQMIAKEFASTSGLEVKAEKHYQCPVLRFTGNALDSIINILANLPEKSLLEKIKSNAQYYRGSTWNM